MIHLSWQITYQLASHKHSAGLLVFDWMQSIHIPEMSREEQTAATLPRRHPMTSHLRPGRRHREPAEDFDGKSAALASQEVVDVKTSAGPGALLAGTD